MTDALAGGAVELTAEARARVLADVDLRFELEDQERRWQQRLALAQAIPETDPPQIHDEESEKRRAYRERYRMLPPKVRGSVLRDWLYCPGCDVLRELTVDHIVPPARGGSDHDSNLWALCRGCNTRKGQRTRSEWRAFLIEIAEAQLVSIRARKRATQSRRVRR
jgi:5-methylcytosine-specific restriction enzyme A